MPDDPRERHRVLTEVASGEPPKLRAYLLTVRDLLDHSFELTKGQPHVIAAPSLANWSGTREEFRERQRRALEAERREQLAEANVQAFITRFDAKVNGRPMWRYLVANPRELAQRLRSYRTTSKSPLPVRPYLQEASQRERFFPGGPTTLDVWRYLRYTWALKQERVPGRVMNFLVRDAAGPGHPVMGLLAVTNGPIHLVARDQWIGWHPATILHGLEQATSAGRGSEHLATLRRRLKDIFNRGLRDLYTQDLRVDGRLTIPHLESIAHRYAKRDLVAPRIEHLPPAKATRKPYYRAKRTRVALAILRGKNTLRILPQDPAQAIEFLKNGPGSDMLATAMGELRKPAIGNYLIDFSTCGAVPPYNHLLAGKLVAMMAVDQGVLEAYSRKYGRETSLIASAMAGRPIRRRPKALIAGTTSLYASHSSQYDRIVIPAVGMDLRYVEVGMTHGQTSMHVSKEALAAYRALLRRGRRHVPSAAFGGGAGAKMRLAHAALRQLGFTDELLVTNLPRLVYAVELAPGARSHLLWGTSAQPYPAFRQPVAEYWWARWAGPRLARRGLATLRATRLTSIFPPH